MILTPCSLVTTTLELSSRPTCCEYAPTTKMQRSPNWLMVMLMVLRCPDTSTYTGQRWGMLFFSIGIPNDQHGISVSVGLVGGHRRPTQRLQKQHNQCQPTPLANQRRGLRVLPCRCGLLWAKDKTRVPRPNFGFADSGRAKRRFRRTPPLPSDHDGGERDGAGRSSQNVSWLIWIKFWFQTLLSGDSRQEARGSGEGRATTVYAAYTPGDWGSFGATCSGR